MSGIDDIPDDILSNILSRLPAKSMGRCRCVSTHWNRLISDASFMMSRSPRIFLRSTPIYILDESSGRITTFDFSIFRIPPNKNPYDRFVSIVGTFNGIIVLSVTDNIEWDSGKFDCIDEHMILYNPFTGVYEIIHDPYSPFRSGFVCYAYGFGYGATTPGDLKVIRVRNFSRRWDICDVFNLKTRSWSQLKLTEDIRFKNITGTFLTGYLYWMGYLKMVVLDVDKMVFSEMDLPDSAANKENHLGTCNGCLWMISNTPNTPKFDVWVLKNEEQGWLKRCSLTIQLEHLDRHDNYQIIEISEDGIIIMNLVGNHVKEVTIYDISKQLYKVLKSASGFEEKLNFVTGVKYKESLQSPMNLGRA